MVYQSVFYKLLDIPKKVAEPTPYHLLGIDPRDFSAANIKNRLESYFQMIEAKRVAV